ncbi:MAG: hypothetical protein V4819_06890 [Verrucomicrobiota bacterium]
MIPGNFHLPRVTGLLLAAATSLMAGNFAAPAEGPVAFRRDQVPLDAETMAGLSRQLMTLAQGLKADTAAERRTAAQMLALSTALDPGNAKARDVLADFEKESHAPISDGDLLGKNRARIWQYLAWLETPEAGAQGQALAACLADVIAVSDPEHPRAQALRGAGERGAWKGWIPGLSAYETKAPVETTPTDETAVADAGVLLKSARVFTPLWKRSAEEPPKWSLAAAPIEMVANGTSEKGEQKPFSLVFVAPPKNQKLTPLISPLLKLLEKQHGSLPAGAQVTLSSPALDESLLSPKLQSISAASAVLASSAISGREPEATIIGLVDETGAFKLPTGFWNQLQSLGAGNGGRLVLPAAAAEYLPSMLALERPQIFFDYEVVLASNFKELLDLTAKTPEGTFAKVSTQFREIREKIGTQPLGQYVANPFIRRRLAEVATEAPYHYSARLLAIQGAGNRPVFVPQAVLTAELRRAIEPMDWLAKQAATGAALEDAEIARIGATYETCHGQVEQLYRYAEKSDREWVERVQAMVTTIRTLDRATRSRGEYYEVSAAVLQAHAAFLRAYAAVVEELDNASGEVEAAAEN